MFGTTERIQRSEAPDGLRRVIVVVALAVGDELSACLEATTGPKRRICSAHANICGEARRISDHPQRIDRRATCWRLDRSSGVAR
jgi:hypothetical protein